MKHCQAYLDRLPHIDRAELEGYASCAKERAGAMLTQSMEQARSFSFWDFAIFKICLISFGVWLGAQFSKFFSKFKVFIFIGFVASYVYLIWRIFFKDYD